MMWPIKIKWTLFFETFEMTMMLVYFLASIQPGPVAVLFSLSLYDFFFLLCMLFNFNIYILIKFLRNCDEGNWLNG